MTKSPSNIIKSMQLLFIYLSIISCEPVVPQNSLPGKKIVFDNYDYENIVGNVNLLPSFSNSKDPIGNPVIVMGQSSALELSFDLLIETTEYLSARIVHCNKDWKKSRLQDLEFLSEINTFRINETENSLNTVQKYVSYTLILPTPNISGNYLILVHRRGNPNDILITRRFVIAENISSINTIAKQSNSMKNRTTTQQIEVSNNYGKIEVNRPLEDISIMILQNHNWNTAIKSSQPTMVRPNESFIEYRPVGLELSFPGWNEYRFFDLRTIDQTGRNVYNLVKNESQISAKIRSDQSRFNKPYSLGFQDVNGRVILGNNDIGRSFLSSDYVNVEFTLESEKINGDVYVVGQFNNWQTDSSNKMIFIPGIGYQLNKFLKQGYYEYAYHVKSNQHPAYYMEGSFFETENDYEVFVYYRKPGTIHDQVIGYKKFKSNSN